MQPLDLRSMATTRRRISFLGESCCHEYLVVLTMMKSGKYAKTASHQDRIWYGGLLLFRPPDFHTHNYTFLFRGWSLEDIDGAPAEYLVVLSCLSRLQYSTSVYQTYNSDARGINYQTISNVGLTHEILLQAHSFFQPLYPLALELLTRAHPQCRVPSFPLREDALEIHYNLKSPSYLNLLSQLSDTAP